jgi:hypothetical protein
VPHSYAGREGACKSCGRLVAAPQAAETLEQPSSSPRPAPQRPAAVTVIAILGLVFGGSGLLFLPFLTFQMIYGSSMLGESLGFLYKNRLYHSWLWTNFALTAIAYGVWVAAGVGLLYLRPWARVAAIWLLICGIGVQVVSLLVGIVVFIILPFPDAMPFPPGTAQQMRFFMAASSIASPLFMIAVCIVLLVIILRPNVAEAFQTAKGQ